MYKSIDLQKWFEKTLKEEDIIDYSVYENVEIIGKGGFGIVYSANSGGKKFALKSLRCDEVNKEAKEDDLKNLKKSLEEQESHEEFQNGQMKPEQNNEFLNKPIIDQPLIKNSQPIIDQPSIKNIEVSSHVNSFEIRAPLSNTINLSDNQTNIGKYRSILSNYALKEFDDSSEDQKLLKAWRLNLAGNNFMTSNRIIFGYNGKLDIVTCSREPLVYAVVNDSSDRPKSFWDKLRDSYPEFSSTRESPFNDICEDDVCLLFPIAEITYSGTINKGSKLDLNRKLILRNFADANSVQIEHFKSHLAWALDSHQSQRENPFEDATIFDFPIIETTNKNLKNPKDLSMWIRRLYEDNVVEIISYEEIVPIFTFLEKVEYTYISDTFINRLIPGISNKHQEITLNDWIEDLPLRNLLTLISKFPFRHGMLVDQFGISLPNNQALAFTQSPIVSKRNNYYLQLIQPETSMEEILLRNKVTHKLSSIPFIEYNSTTQIDNVYLFLHYEKIEIFLDQCVAPLPVFKKAVEDAVRSIHPYRALQEVFNEFGHFLPKSIVLGSQLREILKNQMNTSSHALIKKKFVAASQADVDKILECTKVFDINYLLTSNGQVVMMDQIFDWFSEIENNDEYLKFIRIDQVTPLYKILSYDLQNKIEIILENRLDSRILLTGVKTFDIDDNSTEAYVRINFDENSVLDSSFYDAIGLVFDNKNIRSEDCAISFGLFDCYGFSAFITVKDSTARNIKGWHIIWMIIGKHSLVGAFSENQRETDIAFHNAFVDLTTCYDDFIYIPLSFVLSKNCIILFSTLYSANNPPEQNFKLTRWSKDVLELKITKLNMDQTQLSPFYLNICAVYPREEMSFKVDFGDKLVAYNILGHNLDANNYDQLIDFSCYKNIFLNCLNAELPVKHTEYLCTNNFGYWTIAILETDNSQLVIKHIIKKRLSGLINSKLRYLYPIGSVFYVRNYIRSTNWKTLHHHLKHNGALSEHQAKNIFKQVIECVSFIYKHGFYNIIINDRDILIAESQVKLFNLEHLMSDELNNDLVYDIQYEDDYSISFASPEMISGHDYNPECSDLWLLEKEVSKECSDILHRLLAKNPHLRGSFKYLLKDPWIGINASSKRIVLNNSKENVDKGIINENTSSDEIVQELDGLIKEILHYANKSDFNEYLKRNFVSITWKKKLSIILDIAVGLYQIHDKGIIHRDIHPGNIFLDSSCTCIGDFGLSREADMLTDYKNKLFGVLPYMAPEVLEEGKYSYASDIYAFGIILIKIATGKNVYIGNNNDKLAFDKSIPSIYQNMIDSCCDKKPSNRPNALTLANEIIDWKLNKMHQFNDKKRLLSFTNEETGENEENEDTEEMVGKSQNDIILDQANTFGEYYKNATDGDPEAVKNAAISFPTGNGIERNMKEAFSWFMRCRNKVELTHEELTPLVEYFSQDSPDLEIKLRYGMMLECGLGVVKSLDNAYLVYKNAAESGHARAQFKMGVFCEKGWTINQNSLEALNYINKRYMVSFKPRGKSITIKVNTECLLSKEVTNKVTKIIVKDEHAELRAD
ncbi:22207_t:CDS:10 [Gigaspora margarita]|uniref:22207_t:CDS:1 n=1 Tax=Gigaspora margarita TaxID=4874 RepID=A0ABM8VWG8_GIGMA|nr:22207_t:CDS:10 [Gigaspora margarita]